MSRILSALVVAATVTAILPSAFATSTDAAEPADVFELLASELRLTPEVLDACQTSITQPDGSSSEAECGITPGAAGATSGGQSPFELEATSVMQTPGWHASLTRLRGLDTEAFVRVHGYGDIALTSSDGTTLWSRGSMSLYEDWDAPNGWVNPFVFLGADPLDPRTRASESPYAVADVTGDGVDDVIVSHWVWQRDADNKITTSGFLTVLDGADGRTRWSREYPGVLTQVVAAGDKVVVGRETGDVAGRPGGSPNGEDGSTSELLGLSFEDHEGTLKGTQGWTLSTGKQWARWLAAAPVADGLVAASWMDKPFGAATGVPGHTLVVDAASGVVRHQIENTGGYPRKLRYDASRGALVVAEVPDPTVLVAEGVTSDIPHKYSLRALDLETGSEISSVARNDSILLSLEVAELDGAAPSEWVVGDLVVSGHPNRPAGAPAGAADVILGGRVAALDGATGTERWAWRTGCDADLPAAATCGAFPYTYGLAVTGSPPTVVAASVAGTTTELRGLSAATGQVLWNAGGDPAFPVYVTPVQGRNGPAVATMDPRRIQHIYDAGTGAELVSSPVPFDLHAADAVDLDGDGLQEVIAGGEGGVVFAFDVSQQVPQIVWSAEVGGPVHKLEVVDLGSDGEQDIIVAATSEVAVFDLSGTERSSRIIRYPDPADYVWTFVTGDVNGDGRTDLVVPTTKMTAYEGRFGDELWSFAGTNPGVLAYFSEPVITPDRKVAAQWLTQSGVPFLNARSHMLITALDGATGLPSWQKVVPSKFGIVNLWRSVVVNPDESCGSGSTIGFTWKETITTNTSPGWFARTDFYDSQTGDICYSASQPQGVEHMGTEYIPGTGVLEYNWFNVAHLRRDGVSETEFTEVASSTSDVAMADFGPMGRRFLRAKDIIEAFDPASPTGAYGNNPPKHASYTDFEMGGMHVEDLDGDRSDEVVAMPFDWNGWFHVASFSAVYGFHSSLYPVGFAVLEAR